MPEMMPSTTLAQLGRFIADVPPLPSAPLWEVWLFENPLPGSLAVSALGLMIALALRARQKAAAGLAVLLSGLFLGGMNWATASLVRTDREILIDRTDQLITAVATVDSAGMRERMGERVRLPSVGGLAMVPETIGRSEIIALVEGRLTGAARPIGHDIKNIDAVIDGPNVARSQVSIVVDAQGQSNVGSVWEIAWRLDGDGTWRAVEIELLSLPLAGVGIAG